MTTKDACVTHGAWMPPLNALRVRQMTRIHSLRTLRRKARIIRTIAIIVTTLMLILKTILITPTTQTTLIPILTITLTMTNQMTHRIHGRHLPLYKRSETTHTTVQTATLERSTRSIAKLISSNKSLLNYTQQQSTMASCDQNGPNENTIKPNFTLALTS